MKVIYRTILFLALITITQRSKAQTYVLIPDATFANYLHALVPSAMSGNSLNITSTLVTTTTQTINVSGLNIANLSGIQYFSSLKLLACANNFLTSLPALSDSLYYLHCVSNSLTSLPALPNSLTHLFCNSNNISCFPTFPNSLTYFNSLNNPYNCLPNYVLPAMDNYTNTPLCASGNSNGCPVSIYIGIKEFNPTNDQISVYPNPSSGQLTIKQFDKSETMNEINIYNNLGQLVFSKKVSSLIETIDTSLPKGIYFYSLSSDSKHTFRDKLIIE